MEWTMINPKKLIQTWESPSPLVKKLVTDFVSPEGVGRRYVLGRNEHSAALANKIEVDAFVDDFAPAGIRWNNKPVGKSEAVPKSAILVNCSMCTSPVTAFKKIENLGVAGNISYTDLCRVYPKMIPLPKFVTEMRMDIRHHVQKWEKLAGQLADAQSRKVLDDVLKYRLTGECRYMRGYSVRPRDQYFENFVKCTTDEVFVDAGGFDGDTTEEFCRRYPGYHKVFLFEPSRVNLQKARVRLKEFRGVKYIEKGLSDVAGELAFNTDAGSASAIADSGSTRIKVVTLDDEIQEQVSFIKMDLEGWELKALTGARRHIFESCPKLAIAVYHKASDFWRIFNFVKAVRPDYKVYLRHYTEGWSETVMFFIPRKR